MKVKKLFSELRRKENWAESGEEARKYCRNKDKKVEYRMLRLRMLVPGRS